MKHFLLLLVLLCVAGTFAGVPFRNIGPRALVGNEATLTATSTIFAIESTVGGFLPSRLTTVQRDALASPTEGLLIYNSTDDELQVYVNSSWTTVGSSGSISGTGTDNHIARWDGSSDIQDSGLIIDDSDNLTGVGTLAAGTSTITGTVFANHLTATHTLSANSATVTNLITAGSSTFSNTVGTLNLTATGGIIGATGTFSQTLTATDLVATDNISGASANVTNLITAGSSTFTNNVGALNLTATSGIFGATGTFTQTVTATDLIATDNVSGLSANITNLITAGSSTFTNGVTALDVTATSGIFAPTATISSLSPTMYVATNAAKQLVSTSTLDAQQLSNVVQMDNGGTNKNMTASAGAVTYSDTDSLELSSVGTSGQALVSGGTSAPTWFNPTATQVVFAGTSGELTVDAGLTFSSSTNNLVVAGDVAANTANVTNLITAGSSTFSNTVGTLNLTATGGIIGATGTFSQTLTATDLVATDNVSALSANVTNLITAGSSTFSNNVGALNLTATSGIFGATGTFTQTVTATDLVATDNISALSANVTNLITAGSSTFTNNVEALNLTATSGIFGATGTFTQTVTATDLIATDNVSALSANVTNLITAGSSTFSNNVSALNLTATSGIFGATGTFSQTLTGTDVTATDVLSGNSASVTNLITAGSSTFTNAVTALDVHATLGLTAATATVTNTVTAGRFVGDGSGITGITVTGVSSTEAITLTSDSDSSGNGGFNFDVGTGRKLVISSTGNVGVGTSTPSALFQVNATSTHPELRMMKETNTNGDTIGKIGFFANDDGSSTQEYSAITAEAITSTAGNEGGRMSFSSYAGGTSTSIMHIVNGRVGIGTSDPQARFHVHDDTIEFSRTSARVNYTMKRLDATPTNGDSIVLFGFSGPDSAGNNTSFGNLEAKQSVVTDTAETGQFALTLLQGGASTNVFTAVGGDIGFGTSTPLEDFHVVGDSIITGQTRLNTLVTTSTAVIGSTLQAATTTLTNLSNLMFVATNASGQLISTSTPVAVGSNTYTVNTLSSTTTITASHDVVFVDGSSTVAFTLTLPTAAGITGKSYKFTRTDSATSTPILDADGSETIGGDLTKNFSTIGESWEIVSDGTNWQVLKHISDTDWVGWTPTGTWTSNSTYTGKWRRQGANATIMFNISLAGAPTSAELFVDIPGGWTMATAKMTMDNIQLVSIGTANIEDASNNSFGAGSCYAKTTTTVAPRYLRSSTIYDYSTLSETMPVTFASGDSVTAICTFPVTGWDE